MEILVRDNTFYCLVVGICGGLRQREQELGVEDVEPLVLHGPHVEVVDGHDHEDIEIVLAAIALFVPAHRLLERAHGITALVDVFGLGVDAQIDVTARGSHEAVLHHCQVAGNEREEITGFREWVVPGDAMPTILQVLRI